MPDNIYDPGVKPVNIHTAGFGRTPTAENPSNRCWVFSKSIHPLSMMIFFIALYRTGPVHLLRQQQTDQLVGKG